MSPRFARSGRRRSNVGVWTTPPPITVDQALNIPSGTRTIVAPTGQLTDRYNNGAPANNTTFDLRGLEVLGYVDWDTQYHPDATHQHQTVQRAGVDICGSVYGTNVKMVRLAQGTAASNIAVVGGKATGEQPTTLTWGECKHGRTVQDNWETGGNNEAAQTNDGGSVLLGPVSGSWWYINGYRARNVMDGITINGVDATEAVYATVYIANSYVTARDTAFNSEDGHVFRAFDCLVENTYGLIDVRGGPILPNLQNAWEYCLIRLQKLPGGFKMKRAQSSHHSIYKETARPVGGARQSPQLVLRNCTLALEDTDVGIPSDGVYSNTTICWLGTAGTPYPGAIHPGLTVINSDGSNRTGAENYWFSKRDNWLVRHGFPAGAATNPYTYNVNMDTMIRPQAPPL